MSQHQNINAIASLARVDELSLWTFRRMQSAMRIGFQDAFSGVGLTAAQAMILLATPQGRWVKQVELQRLTELTESKLVSPLEDLVRRGVVIRQQDPDDRRRNRVRLTAEGLQLADDARACHARLDETLFSQLSPDERGRLTGLLERVVAGVRANQAD